jgi:hypothetical protein
LKALVIMIVRHLRKVHELLTVSEQPTPEMQTLSALLTVNGLSWPKTFIRSKTRPSSQNHSLG